MTNELKDLFERNRRWADETAQTNAASPTFSSPIRWAIHTRMARSDSPWAARCSPMTVSTTPRRVAAALGCAV